MSEPTYRDTAPDALFGAVLALECTLGVLLRAQFKDIALSEEFPQALLSIRVEAEAVFETLRSETKYGTGAEDIRDGAAVSFDAIFGQPEGERRQTVKLFALPGVGAGT